MDNRFLYELANATSSYLAQMLF